MSRRRYRDPVEELGLGLVRLVMFAIIMWVFVKVVIPHQLAQMMAIGQTPVSVVEPAPAPDSVPE